MTDDASDQAVAGGATASAGRVHVVVATKGRPAATGTLCAFLARQSHAVATVVVVGSEPGDIAGLDQWRSRLPLELIVAGSAGASLQRNQALARLLDGDSPAAHDDLIVFFDDDYRPADDWLEQAVAFLSANPGVVGLTGRVLGDGVKRDALSEDEAADLIAARAPPQPHWASGDTVRDIAALYGCNMAIRASALRRERFDENLPLYSWQEDMDLTGRIVRLGRTVYAPVCRGVHLGMKSGRTSGLRLGYSQVANPIYLARKGSCRPPRAARFVGRALAGNAVRSLRTDRLFDFRGRFAGNLIALGDLLRGRLDPRRILDL